jgi:hypothetical protein
MSEPTGRRRGIPRYLWKDIIFTTDNLARALRDENKGRVDESLLVIRLADELTRRPELINIGMLASEVVVSWSTLHAKALAKSRRNGSIYAPGLYIPVRRRQKHAMKVASLIELLGWDSVELIAAKGAMKVIEAYNENSTYRNSRQRAFIENPGIITLHDLEIRVFGYQSKDEPVAAPIESVIDDDEGDGDDNEGMT